MIPKGQEKSTDLVQTADLLSRVYSVPTPRASLHIHLEVRREKTKIGHKEEIQGEAPVQLFKSPKSRPLVNFCGHPDRSESNFHFPLLTFQFEVSSWMVFKAATYSKGYFGNSAQHACAWEIRWRYSQLTCFSKQKSELTPASRLCG